MLINQQTNIIEKVNEFKANGLKERLSDFILRNKSLTFYKNEGFLCVFAEDVEFVNIFDCKKEEFVNSFYIKQKFRLKDCTIHKEINSYFFLMNFGDSETDNLIFQETSFSLA